MIRGDSDSDSSSQDGSDTEQSDSGEDDLDKVLAGYEQQQQQQNSSASRPGTLERDVTLPRPGGTSLLCAGDSSATLGGAGAVASSRRPSMMDAEAGHGQILELYVLVARCIAFPFTAQARNSMSRTRHLKLTETDLVQYCVQFEGFLRGDMPMIVSDEAFDKAILCYYDNFLVSKRLLSLVRSGGCTFADLRKVFQNYVEKFLKNLPLMERVKHDHVLAIWMSKYEAICRGNLDMETARRDSLAILRERQSVDDSVAPDHLYKVFQLILGIPQREHHLLSKELQLDNADEQATVIRRELRHRLTFLAQCDMKEIGLLLVSTEPNMAQEYLAEQHSHITKLSSTLNQMPISKKPEAGKRPKPLADDANDPGTVNKSDISISTSVSLTVRQARGVEFLPPDKPVFCLMEMDGHQSRMATAQYPASRPIWDTFATFPTSTPLPLVRIKLMADSKGILDADGKQIAKLSLQPTLCQSDGDRWYKMTPTVSLPDKNHHVEVQACVSIDKADNVKISGWLYCIGKDPWKKWKKHYFVLVQMTTYAFALCTFRDKQQTPAEVMTMTGCTVDYCGEDARRGVGEEGYTEFQFQLLISDNAVIFCSSSRNQMEQWVYHLARATGQAQRPQAPQGGGAKPAAKPQARTTTSALRELELDEQALTRDITWYDHGHLYATLLGKTLDQRLKDPASSMGWLTPGQQFVLDEYQARYCLRGFVTHLAMIRTLMEHASAGTYIDASLMQFSFTFCQAHIQGQKPDNYNSVTKEEREDFLEVLENLEDLLRFQLARLSHSFPFCLPDSGLKSTLRLFARVVSTRDGRNDALSTDLAKVASEVCDCLRKAALICYTDVVEDVKARMAGPEEEAFPEEVDTSTLEFLVCLSEECIDQMGQSQVDYAKAFSDYEGSLDAFEESFWQCYDVDLELIVEGASMENGKVFQVFEQINSYLLSHLVLRDGKFHKHLLSLFMPLVANYLDLMSVALEKEMVMGIASETWRQEQTSAKCAEELFVKLRGLHRFVQRLAWPEPLFAEHLEKRAQRAIADLLLSLCTRTYNYFKQVLARQSPHAEALYIAPRQCWVLIDVVTASIEQASLLCVDRNNEDDGEPQPALVEYGGNIRMSLLSIQEQMMTDAAALLNFTVDDILVKLSLHDPANIVFSLLNRIRKSRVDLDDLSLSVEHNLQALQECTGATSVADIVMTWYDSLLSLIHGWLEKRPQRSLKFPQFDTLQGALEVIVHRFVIYFNTEQDARTTLLTAVEERLRLEQSAHELEATVKSM
ncbi:calcium-dependent secretion activator-like [Sycon ciliatum]|uniref:calcium-dependent secretion activator-like n=1 Tax=Sycon ciliatum TaxID=27933 RepID=UPI0031F63CBB